jgi:hypothetical protein
MQRTAAITPPTEINIIAAIDLLGGFPGLYGNNPPINNPFRDRTATIPFLQA